MSKGKINLDNQSRLSRERLLEVLSYDPDTGFLSWKKRIGPVRPGKRAGSLSGCPDYRYREVQIDGIGYYEHRLIWFYVTGEWPKSEIDHRDTDATNNKWSNLREATSSQNKWNARMSSRNRTGLKGVARHTRNSKFWMARLTVRGKTINLGLFRCPAAAHFSYVVAADRYHGEFARTA